MFFVRLSMARIVIVVVVIIAIVAIAFVLELNQRSSHRVEVVAASQVASYCS